MIPVDKIASRNLHSQADAPFLLGEGFTPKAARSAICSACIAGELPSRKWSKRHWFYGRDFLDWIRRRLAPPDTDGATGVEKTVASRLIAPQNEPAESEPVRRPSRKGVGQG